MKPAETLELQHDLARWWDSSHGVKYGIGWTESTLGSNDYYRDTGLRGDALRRAAERGGKGLAEREAYHLHRASTYWVSADMVRLAEAAGESMAPQPLKPTDLPTPSGFVWLEKPIRLTDVRGKTVSVQGVLWADGTDGDLGKFYPGAAPTGIALCLYSGWEDEEDEGMVELRDDWEKERNQGVQWRRPPMLFFSNDPWMFDRTPEDELTRDWVGNPDEHMRENALVVIWQMRTFMAALWTLMQQTLADTTTVQPTRAVRRRIKRAGILDDDALQVRVVTLRKRAQRHQDADTNSNVEWSHQWVVNGHWRNQWYPSLGYHRQIWIDSFIKGPEDKPLVTKGTVFALKR